MTTNQMFFSVAGLLVTVFGLGIAFFKYYIDAKLGPNEQKYRHAGAVYDFP